MTIKEIINRINKSPEFQDEVGISSMAELMDLPVYEWGHGQTRLTCYFVSERYCAGYRLGIRVYFFDNETVAISSQTGRKSTEHIEWVSPDAYKKVKEYVLSFGEEKEIENISICNMDEELGDAYKIDYVDELCEHHKKSTPLFDGKKVKIIDITVDKKSYAHKKIKIQMKDKTTKIVDIGELDFPYNIK